MTTTDTPTNRSTQMNLINEDLARAHRAQRLGEAQDLGLGRQVDRARRVTRRAERVAHQARLTLARSL
jgi:hypothetical protein